MKRVFTLLLLLCLLPGCGGPTADAPPEDGWAVGVLRTSGFRNESAILYFDENLAPAGTLSFPYATFGELFYPPAVTEDAVYIIPQGQANRKDLRCILALDLATFDARRYDLDQIAIYSPSAGDGALYTVSNLNGDSFLSRIDLVSGDTDTAIFENRYLSAAQLCGDTVYAFSSDSAGGSVLHCVDPRTLAERRRIDLSALGTGVFSMAYDGTALYFAPTESIGGAAPRCIGVYRPDSSTVEALDCGQTVFQLLWAEGRLYLSHGNLVTGEGTQLSLYDPVSGVLTTHDLGLWPAQVAAHGGALYVLSRDALAKFSLDTLAPLGETAVASGEDFYLSGLFAAPH